jgi:hypothetical protein
LIWIFLILHYLYSILICIHLLILDNISFKFSITWWIKLSFSKNDLVIDLNKLVLLFNKLSLPSYRAFLFYSRRWKLVLSLLYFQISCRWVITINVSDFSLVWENTLSLHLFIGYDGSPVYLAIEIVSLLQEILICFLRCKKHLLIVFYKHCSCVI